MMGDRLDLSCLTSPSLGAQPTGRGGLVARPPAGSASFPLPQVADVRLSCSPPPPPVPSLPRAPLLARYAGHLSPGRLPDHAWAG